MPTIRQRIARVPSPAWWLAGVLLVYTLLGFLLVPWVAERQLGKLLRRRLSLASDVAAIAFNPFTFIARVDGLDIHQADGDPLLRLGTLQVNFQPVKLALLRFQFEELVARDLDIYLARDRQGVDTLSLLAQAWAASAEEGAVEPAVAPPDEEGGLPPVVVNSIAFDNISLHVRDALPVTPFATTLTLASARIANLSTLANSAGTNALILHFEDQAQLHWRGQLQLSPPLFTGEVGLENFALATVGRYLQDSLPLTVDSGRLNAALTYRLDMTGEALSLTMEQIQASVSGVALTRAGQSRPFFTADLLQAGNGRLTVPANRLDFASLQARQLALALIRNGDGTTNLQQMLASLPQAANSAAGPDPVTPGGGGEPWSVSLGELVLAANRVSVTDETTAPPAEFAVAVDLEVSGLNNRPGAVFPWSAALVPDSGGALQLQGSVGVLPALDLAATVALKDLDLTVLQPYLDQVALVQVESALLDSASEVLINREEPLAFRGDVRLHALSVRDQRRQERLLALDSLQVSRIDFARSVNTLDISEVVFDALFARVLINEDGSTNVGQLVRQDETRAGAATEPPAEPQGAGMQASALTVSVGRIRVNEAASDFTDLNLPIPFNANIRELSGAAEGLSAPSAEPVEFVLEGNVDEFGLVQLDSLFNPFAMTEQSRIDLQFRNLDMPPLTPYVIKFAGREIASGNLDVDLSYQLESGQLQASNQVVLRDLALGARVAHPDAMDLPLDLALALLKDGRGVIDLEVPVSGDVNSPEFDIGPALRRAIANVLTNLVTAPFRLLGALVGGDGDADIGTIRFQAGRADLAPPERQILEQLRGALLQRPELVLEIPVLVTAADREALQVSQVTERVNGRIDQLPDGESSLTERRVMALEALYVEAGLQPDPASIQLANQLETSVPNPLTGEPLVSRQLDVQAYVSDLRSRLVAVEPVSEQQLAELGQARRDAVRDYLLADGQLPATQLASAAVQSADPDDDGWLLMEFGLHAGPVR